MKRKRKNLPAQQANAILSADWHLREDIPTCRTDDFQKVQWEKVDFIAELQRQHNCPVFVAGDIFHHWKPSPWLISKAIEHLPDQLHVCYGNHDLPQHNLELAEKSGIYTLLQAGKLQIAGVHWNQKPSPFHVRRFFYENTLHKNMTMWHVHVYKQKEPWPGCTSPKARTLLMKYPNFDLILTGDNHIPFTEEIEGRLLVNPGSLMRQSAAQINFRPRVYLWYAKTNTVEKAFLPIIKDAVSREHIEKTKERDNRIDSFISALNTDFQKSINFKENLERFFQNNSVQNAVKNIVYKNLE